MCIFNTEKLFQNSFYAYSFENAFMWEPFSKHESGRMDNIMKNVDAIGHCCTCWPSIIIQQSTLLIYLHELAIIGFNTRHPIGLPIMYNRIIQFVLCPKLQNPSTGHPPYIISLLTWHWKKFVRHQMTQWSHLHKFELLLFFIALKTLEKRGKIFFST